jgi:hypothetical protein
VPEQLRQGQAGQLDGTQHVGGDLLGDLVSGGVTVQEPVPVERGRVVDQQADRAEPALHLVKDAGQPGEVGEVEPDGVHTGYPFGRGGEPVRVAGTDDHGVAGRDQVPGQLQADAGAATGDEREMTRSLHEVKLLFK